MVQKKGRHLWALWKTDVEELRNKPRIDLTVFSNVLGCSSSIGIFLEFFVTNPKTFLELLSNGYFFHTLFKLNIKWFSEIFSEVNSKWFTWIVRNVSINHCIDMKSLEAVYLRDFPGKRPPRRLFLTFIVKLQV